LPEQHAAEARYPIPVEDFHFSIFTAVNNQTVMTSSAEIVLVIEGTATLSHASGESLLLHVGLSLYLNEIHSAHSNLNRVHFIKPIG
ncbi:TPA: hypothetical protein ACF2T9_003724, partial [Escherichia coli]